MGLDVMATETSLQAILLAMPPLYELGLMFGILAGVMTSIVWAVTFRI